MKQANANTAGLICSCQALQCTPELAAGSFRLPPHQALTLTVGATGELRITHGQVWLTFVNAARDASARAGDHFLKAGASLQLGCGQQVVMEAYQQCSDAPGYFSWQPNAVLQQTAAPQRRQTARRKMRRKVRSKVREPWLDLGAALRQAGSALGRLVRGVTHNLVCVFVPGRCVP